MKLAVFALLSLSFAPVTLSLSTGLEEARWSNAKRMANGLPPRAPRRFYNNNVARDPTPSPTFSASESDTPTPTSSSPSSSASSPPSALPTAAVVQAYVVGVVAQSAAPAPQPTMVRRQTVGTSVGYLTQVAKLSSTNRNIRFSLTAGDEVAKGLYPTDYQQPTAANPISEFICLSNGHSLDQSRTEPITLSPDTGDYLYLADCGSDLDQPAGSPPTHNPLAVEPEYYGETRVWQVDGTTGQITFHYVNPDGSVAPGQVPVTFYCPEYGPPGTLSGTSVFVTANPALFLELWVQKWSYLLQDPGSCVVNEIAIFYSTS